MGFTKNARTTDHILTFKTLIDKCNSGRKMYTCFVDFKKAFDSVGGRALMYKLLKHYIGGNLRRLPELQRLSTESRCQPAMAEPKSMGLRHVMGIRVTKNVT